MKRKLLLGILLAMAVPFSGLSANASVKLNTGYSINPSFARREQSENTGHNNLNWSGSSGSSFSSSVNEGGYAGENRNTGSSSSNNAGNGSSYSTGVSADKSGKRHSENVSSIASNSNSWSGVNQGTGNSTSNNAGNGSSYSTGVSADKSGKRRSENVSSIASNSNSWAGVNHGTGNSTSVSKGSGFSIGLVPVLISENDSLRLEKVKLKRFKVSRKGKKISAKWKKLSKKKGSDIVYEIQISERPDFLDAYAFITRKHNKYISALDDSTALKDKTRYYVRVRAVYISKKTSKRVRTQWVSKRLP